jgi:anti-sigma regulatory factor (Ser/Thr protein kinase)
MGEVARYTLRSEPDRSSVGEARHLVVDKLGVPLDDPVVLVVSELVTNAIKHAHSAYVLRLESRGHHIRVEVEDTSGTFPVVLPAKPVLSGWGLAIVEALADRWGVVHSRSGTCVWAEFDQLEPNRAGLT